MTKITKALQRVVYTKADTKKNNDSEKSVGGGSLALNNVVRCTRHL